MIELLYLIVLGSILILLAGLRISILASSHRIWPPPKREPLQYWVSWFFISVASCGVLVIGVLDFDSMWLSHWTRFPIVVIMGAISTAIFYKSIRTLNYHQSLGLERTLVEKGSHRYSKNPQYVGLILLYVAIILFTNSFLVLTTGSLLFIVYAVTPFSEELWLLERYEEAYARYKQQVHRFFGRASCVEDATPSRWVSQPIALHYDRKPLQSSNIL